MPLRSLAFLVYFCGSSGAALAFPMVGVVCYIVLYHVYPQNTWWGPYLNFLGIRYSFVCGLCLIVGTTLNLNRLRFGRQFFHPLEWMCLAVLFSIVLSTAMGASWTERSVEFLDKMAKVFLFTFMLSHVVVTRRRLWQLTVLLTMLALYLGHEAKIAPPGAFMNNRLDGIGGPDFRESAGLAIHLFALMPFVAIVLLQKKLWLKGLAFFAAGYSMNAILLCRARSAFVAGIVAGVVAIWYVPRQYRRWIILALILGAIGGFILSDEWFWERMMTITSSGEEREGSAAIRLGIWRGAWEMFKEHPWGIGVGYFRYRIGNYVDDPFLAGRDAHNSFVICATELGFLGLAFYVGALTIAWCTLSRLSKRIRTQLPDPGLFELLVLAARLALIVYVISGLFVSRFYTEGAWWFIVLPVCLKRAVENEIHEEVQQEVKIQKLIPGLMAHQNGPVRGSL